MDEIWIVEIFVFIPQAGPCRAVLLGYFREIIAALDDVLARFCRLRRFAFPGRLRTRRDQDTIIRLCYNEQRPIRV